MHNIIKIETRTIESSAIQTVNARDLHVFLEVGKDFSTWIKDRIEQYGFEEGRDFVLIRQIRRIKEAGPDGFDSPNLGNQKRHGGDRRSKDYHLTLDMAKELAMVERNEKGKQARQYFIECERQAKQGPKAEKPTALAPAKEFRALYGIARLIGLDKNVASIAANQAVAKMTGTNVLGLLGQVHLDAENQHALYFTPTELGKQIGVSARALNMLLAEAGLQARKGEHWTPLAAADGFCRILDTGKRHGDGTMIQQVKWAENVLALVRPDLDEAV